MKIGYYCESPADQAAVRIFTEGTLGAPPEPIGIELEARPVPAFFNALDGVFRGVHYNSDAEGLVIVVDCDDTTPHAAEHDAAGGRTEGCRQCQARQIIGRARSQIKPREDRPPLLVALGLAVPAIEAWYLVGRNHQVGEAAWLVGLCAGQPPLSRPELKRLVYGTERPSLELETERAVAEARRIIGDLKAIETAFPAGFGLMAAEMRNWLTPPDAVG